MQAAPDIQKVYGSTEGEGGEAISAAMFIRLLGLHTQRSQAGDRSLVALAYFVFELLLNEREAVAVATAQPGVLLEAPAVATDSIG